VQSGTTSEHPFDSMMIAPGEQKEFVFKQIHAATSARLSFSSINDYGARDRYVAQLSSSAETSANPDKESP
jgi:P pilus assembly chaperone PapD